MGMQFKLDGTEYDVDVDRISVKEMRELKEHAGLGVATLATGVLQGDIDALCALVWLGKRRNNEAVRWRDLDFAPVDLLNQLGTVQYRILAVAMASAEGRAERLRALADDIDAGLFDADAAAEAGEADPTPPSGPLGSTSSA